jgi:hypothetical protein
MFLGEILMNRVYLLGFVEPVKFIALFLILLASQTYAGTQSVSIDIGEQTIHLPAPEGFYEVNHFSESIRKFTETLTPPENRLLAVFVSGKAFGQIMKDDSTWIKNNATLGDRYMMIQVFREDENKIVSSMEYAQFKDSLKQEQLPFEKIKGRVGAIIKKATDEISKEHDIALDYKYDKPVSLGVFIDKPDVVAFAVLMKTQRVLNRTSTLSFQIGGTSVLKTKNKILFIYVYSNFDTTEDLAWVQAVSSRWVDQILLANQVTRISQKSSIAQSPNHLLEISGALTEKNKKKLPDESMTAILTGDKAERFIIFWIILTWGIGLTPPLLIRFLLLRRPMEKKYALGIVGLFWVFNLLIFTALGNKSKTHFGLILVALVSYGILRKKTIQTTQS